MHVCSSTCEKLHIKCYPCEIETIVNEVSRLQIELKKSRKSYKVNKAHPSAPSLQIFRNFRMALWSNVRNASNESEENKGSL